jgi:hypothetical protein
MGNSDRVRVTGPLSTFNGGFAAELVRLGKPWLRSRAVAATRGHVRDVDSAGFVTSCGGALPC